MRGYIGSIPAGQLMVSPLEPQPLAWWALREPHGGDAPEDIKLELIGVPLPLRHGKAEHPTPRKAAEIISGRLYDIPDEIWFRKLDVVRALILTQNRRAAEFWYEHAPGSLNLSFEFDRGTFLNPQEVYADNPLFAQFDYGAISMFVDQGGYSK